MYTLLNQFIIIKRSSGNFNSFYMKNAKLNANIFIYVPILIHIHIYAAINFRSKKITENFTDFTIDGLETEISLWLISFYIVNFIDKEN